MMDETRRAMADLLNAVESPRAALEHVYGRVWDTDELQRDFTVLGFLAPFVVVQRKADNVRGTLTFQHHPRFYFLFKEE